MEEHGKGEVPQAVLGGIESIIELAVQLPKQDGRSIRRERPADHRPQPLSGARIGVEQLERRAAAYQPPRGAQNDAHVREL